jgi:cell surface protein SprA
MTNKNVTITNDLNLNMSHSLRRPKTQVVPYPGWPTSAQANTDSALYIETPWIHTDSNQEWTTRIGDELSVSYDLKTARGFQVFKWYFRLKNNINLRLNTGLTFEQVRLRERPVVLEYKPLENNEFQDGELKQIACDENGNCHVVYKPLFLEETPDMDRIASQAWDYYIKPSAAYTFNKMASGSALVEYRYHRNKMSDGTANNIHTLRFEIALMLRFD